MKDFLAVFRDGVRIFNKNGCFTSAAAISFYAFFSLIPLMLLIIAGLGFFLGLRADMLERVVGMVRQTLPYLSESIIYDLRELSVNWKTFGWLGVLSLISSAELVMSAASDSLTSIFEADRKFSFFRKKVVNLFVIFVAIVAALSSVALTAVTIVLERFEINVFGIGLIYNLLFLIMFRFVAPFFLVALVAAMVYRILSGPKLPFRYAIFGSMLFTLLWEAAKQLFAWYVSNFMNYNRIYGSLGTLMVLLLWIFYSANIFLFSACVVRAAYLRGGDLRPHPVAYLKGRRHRFKN